MTPWPTPDHPCDHRWHETSTEADRAAGLRHYECDCTARRTIRGESEVL